MYCKSCFLIFYLACKLLSVFITKFELVYDKYYPVIDEETGENKIIKRDIKDLELIKYFNFSGGTIEEQTQELNKFMYVDASLEIFGHAGEVKLNSVEHLNQLQLMEKHLQPIWCYWFL